MKQLDADEVAVRLTDRLGIGLSATTKRDSAGEYVDLAPTGLPQIEAFTIRVRLGWRSVEAEFVPGDYSAELLQEMGRASVDGKAIFRALAGSAVKHGAKMSMLINGAGVDPGEPESWPANWQACRITISRSPIVIEPSDTAMTKSHVFEWGGTLFGMVLALLPVEEVEEPALETSSLPEGAKSRVEVNRYERSALNRAACIAHWGTACQVCGFDFGHTYGRIGEGFIHVHHVTPVSRLGDGYVIDPVKDLLPVCANCHAMFHRVDPPYLPEQLRTIVEHGAVS